MIDHADGCEPGRRPTKRSMRTVRMTFTTRDEQPVRKISVFSRAP